MKKIIDFFTKDKVFLIAFILAIFSAILKPPNEHYLTYINFDVLIIMFAIMISVSGIYQTHFFDFVATKLVLLFKSIRFIALMMIVSTFFLGMLLTNDAVLLTLVPFSVFILTYTKQTKHLTKVILLQTIAANMGSALTPMGDPQNIYLFSFYEPSVSLFLASTLPITVTGFILLFIFTLILIPNQNVTLDLYAPEISLKKFVLYLSVLISALLHILGIIEITYTLLYTLIFILFYGKNIIKSIDIHLLLTFVAFFIITGNLSSLHILDDMLKPTLSSPFSVYITSFLTSQIISNVPAAVLLSQYTDRIYFPYLLQGVNVGAMGSIIGSLASLISLKYMLKDYKSLFKRYLMEYTLVSFVFIIIITLVLFI